MTNNLKSSVGEGERMKYIVFEDGSYKIFPCSEIHTFMTGGKEAVSAGFVTMVNDSPTEVFGESTTLGVKSRPEDLTVISKNL